MSYIILRPYYTILRKYIRFQESKKSMEDQYPDGYTIYMDLFNNDELIETLRSDFNTILDRYQLQNHRENLLYLALSKRVHIDDIIFNLQEQYQPKIRIKELAQLLLAFKTNSEERLNSLQLKTLTDTIKVKDQSLIAWIGELVQEAIEQDNFPIGLLSLGDDRLNGTNEELAELANHTIPKPRLELKYYLPQFCIFLYPYLTAETNIRPTDSVTFSDAELNFYFDLAVLLQMIDPNQISSDPKDYMRTILRNNLTPVNA